MNQPVHHGTGFDLHGQAQAQEFVLCNSGCLCAADHFDSMCLNANGVSQASHCVAPDFIRNGAEPNGQQAALSPVPAQPGCMRKPPVIAIIINQLNIVPVQGHAALFVTIPALPVRAE